MGMNRTGSGYGSGSGAGAGYGSGSGSGYGAGNGDGAGNGAGNGDGNGAGNGDGDGLIPRRTITNAIALDDAITAQEIIQTLTQSERGFIV